MRSPRCRRRTVLLSFILLSPVAALAADQRAGAETTAPSYSFPRDADTVVVRFDRVPGEFAAHDTTPLLRVYGDGTVRVHYPSWQRGAGDYQLKLRASELQDLVAGLVGDGLPAFDAKVARRRIDEAHRLRVDATVVHDISDPLLTVVEVRIDTGASDDGAARARTAAAGHEVRWTNLQDDARRHPQVEEIGRLAAAERRLLELTRRADLAPVE